MTGPRKNGPPAREHGPSLRSGPENGDEGSRAHARGAAGTPTDRARDRGLPGHPVFKPRSGAVEGSGAWNDALASTLTNAALSDAGIEANTPERARAYQPWRQAVLRLLPAGGQGWQPVARALTAHQLEEGAGRTSGSGTRTRRRVDLQGPGALAPPPRRTTHDIAELPLLQYDAQRLAPAPTPQLGLGSRSFAGTLNLTARRPPVPGSA